MYARMCVRVRVCACVGMFVCVRAYTRVCACVCICARFYMPVTRQSVGMIMFAISNQWEAKLKMAIGQRYLSVQTKQQKLMKGRALFSRRATETHPRICYFCRTTYDAVCRSIVSPLKVSGVLSWST